MSTVCSSLSVQYVLLVHEQLCWAVVLVQYGAYLSTDVVIGDGLHVS